MLQKALLAHFVLMKSIIWSSEKFFKQNRSQNFFWDGLDSYLIMKVMSVEPYECHRPKRS